MKHTSPTRAPSRTLVVRGHSVAPRDQRADGCHAPRVDQLLLRGLEPAEVVGERMACCGELRGPRLDSALELGEASGVLARRTGKRREERRDPRAALATSLRERP